MPSVETPDVNSIDPTLDLFAEIDRLRHEKKAIILAHYYQDPDIQDIADHLGDSLDLAKRARDAKDAEVILFCGVHFMAETAKILNPSKTVILPDLEAGCSLAEQCPPDQLRAWKAQHPDHYVVMYINCSAGTKAESDMICTSSNAAKMVREFDGEPLIFAPDRHLARFVAKEAGRDDLIVWQGACVVHEQFSAKRLAALRLEHPDADVLAHPECDQAVLDQADFIA